MAIRHRIITVGMFPTLLNPSHDDERNALGFSMSIQNSDAVKSIYLGSSNVTTSDFGKVLVGGAEMDVSLEPDEALYAVCAAGSVAVYCLFQGV